jgi:hypothetical protein
MKTPESAARAAPPIHTVRMTPSTSIPDAAASERLSATARVAFPIFVRSRMKATASNSTMATTAPATSVNLRLTEPITRNGFGSLGSESRSAPQMNAKT